MEIHKPKPWHGWREFLKEYLIIVVGVLTALALEQAVEWVHWRDQILATEEALRPEITRNLLDSYERVMLLPCFSRRVTDLRDHLQSPGSRWTADPDPRLPPGLGSRPELAGIARFTYASEMKDVVLTSTRPWGDSAYQTALAAGVFNHMPRREAQSYGVMHRAFEQMKEWQAADHAAKVRLAALAFDTTLTPAEKHEYLNVLGELTYVDHQMEGSAAQVLQGAAKVGFRIQRSALDARLKTASPISRACLYLPAVPLDPS